MFRIYLIINIVILLVSKASPNVIEKNDNNIRSGKFLVQPFVEGNGQIIQLNVTLYEKLSSGYEIHVESIESTTNESSHCKTLGYCVAHGSSSDLSTYIPSDGRFIIIDRDPCNFQNDCTYKVSIKSYNEKFDESIIVHTEECIKSVCACKHADLLPEPKIITKRIKNREELYLEWKIEKDDLSSLSNEIYLEHLYIDIKEIEDCKATWTGTDFTANSYHVSLNNHGVPKYSGDFTKKFKHHLKRECLRIAMKVIDSKNCRGPLVEIIEKIPKESTLSKDIDLSNPKDSSNLTIQFVVITAFSILILCSVVMLMVYGYIWWNRKKNIINYWRSIYHNNPPHSSSGTQMMPIQRENPLYIHGDFQMDDYYEIPASAIKEIGREIGKGAFGRVYIARISDIPGRFQTQLVAIKKLKRNPKSEQLEEFLSEISMMQKVGKHPNIVRLFGACVLDKSQIMVMEYVPCGDLLKYLRAVRSKHEATLRLSQHENQLSNNNNNSNCSAGNAMKHSTSSQTILGPLGKYLEILTSHSTSSASDTSSYITQPDSLPSLQIGNGTSRPSFAETMYTNLTLPSNSELTPMIPSLEYIVDHTELHNFAIQIARGMKHLEEKQITHRDLAARNILIDENKTLKISDFGLSRTGIYVNTRNKKVPLRWLSIEAMRDNLYSSKSDVWSFAIVLWEIATLGGSPYPTVLNHELLNFLKSGQRLEKPEICSDSLYELMLQCWATDQNDRPSFSEIHRRLDPNRNRIYIDFSELSPTYVFPPTDDECRNHKSSKFVKT